MKTRLQKAFPELKRILKFIDGCSEVKYGKENNLKSTPNFSDKLIHLQEYSLAEHLEISREYPKLNSRCMRSEHAIEMARRTVLATDEFFDSQFFPKSIKHQEARKALTNLPRSRFDDLYLTPLEHLKNPENADDTDLYTPSAALRLAMFIVHCERMHLLSIKHQAYNPNIAIVGEEYFKAFKMACGSECASIWGGVSPIQLS